MRVGCEQCTVLAGARVFDGSRTVPATVVLRGTHIEAVHEGAVDIVAGEVVSLPGRTIVPGLIDAHVHIRPSASPPAMADAQRDADAHFKAFLRAGVTTVLDLGTERHVVFAYRQRIRDRALLAPSLLAAGSGLTPTGGHPCYEGTPAFDLCAFVDDPADAARAVEDLAPDEPDVIKVLVESGSDDRPLPEIDSDTLRAITDAAEARDTAVFAHVSETSDVRKALDAGVRHLAHLPVRDRIDAGLAAEMASLGVVVVPTLAVIDARHRAAEGLLEEVERPGAADDIPEAVVEAWQDAALTSSVTEPESRAEAARRWDNIAENFRMCLSAGVTLMAGTDAGNPATFHGLSLPRELALYVQAGMSQSEALRAATMQAASVLGLADRGRIEAGMRADLLVVRGDPTEDIDALTHVDRVYVLGESVPREELVVSGDAVLERASVSGLEGGEPCLHATECASGLLCTWDHWCRPDCSSGSCPQESACFGFEPRSSGPYCHFGDGCDPLEQDCPNATSCIWLGEGVTRCWYPGKGTSGEPCGAWGRCAPGYQCDPDASVCVRLCDPGAEPPACEPGRTCVDRSLEAGRKVGECR